jgi:histidyl-tRNA synthetase
MTSRARKRTASKRAARSTRSRASRKREPFRAPAGFVDILPEEQKYWEVITDVVKRVCRSFNLEQIETPLIERRELFVRGVGAGTDIVEKEMYAVKPLRGTGQGGLVLRPEATAAIARAYIEHGMYSLPQPVRLFYFGPYFRHDRPQAGRFRQFYQFGVEIIGERSPLIDVQVIQIAHEILQELSLEDYRIEVSSLGTPASRRRYVGMLRDYYRVHRRKLCAHCRRRLRAQPLRLLDCKEEKCLMLAHNAPSILDYLDEETAAHFAQVTDALQALAIPYAINPRLVRGLDYYVRTVFEVVPVGREEERQSALGGGGRYDGLIKTLGGPDVPGVGFACGVERVIAQMKAEGVSLLVRERPEVFLVQLGAQAKRRALTLFADLRRAGIRVAEAFHEDGIKEQLALANKLRIPWALILGQKEVLAGNIILRNMDSGVQETLDLDLAKLVPALKKRLRRDEEVLS